MAFRRLFSLPVIESDPDLKVLLKEKIKVRDREITLEEYLESRTWPTVFNFQKRQQSIGGTIVELLRLIDFSQLQEEVSGRAQRFLLSETISSIAFTEFFVAGAELLTDKHLSILIKKSPFLSRLELERCHSITEQGIDLIISSLPKDQLKITIRDCKQISVQYAKSLKQQGFNFKWRPMSEIKKIQKSILKHSDASLPRCIDNAVGLLESGKLEEAGICLVQVETNFPGIIEKYKEVITRYTNGISSLNVAIHEGALTLVKFFVDLLGFNVNGWDQTGYTPLQMAASNNQVEIIRFLLEHGAIINRTGAHERTPLHEAIFKQTEEAALFLIEKGADVHEKLAFNSSLLHLAISKNLLVIAKTLVENGVDIQTTCTCGYNVLHYIAESCLDKDFISWILEKNISLSPRNCSSPLLLAAKAGNLPFLDLILSESEIKKNYCHVRNNDGQSILHVAVSIIEHPPEFLEFLVKTFPDLLEARDNRGVTPLLLACKFHNLTAIKLLISAGASIEEIDNQKSTCLHYAVEYDKPHCYDCVKLLLEYDKEKCGLNKRDYSMQTPLAKTILLMYKDIQTRTAICDVMIENGADLCKCCDERYTIVHLACRLGVIAAIPYLLKKMGTSEKPFCLSRVDLQGWNTLHYAVNRGNLEIAKFLLEVVKKKKKNLLLCTKNIQGDDPVLLIATAPRNRVQFMKLFHENGCKFDSVNKMGESLRDLAIKYNDEEVIQFLKKIGIDA